MARNGKYNLLEHVTTSVERPSILEVSDWRSALINLSYEPIFVWDWDEGIIEWNTGAERQYGFERAEVLGKASHEVLATKHPVSLRRFLKKLEAESYWAGEVRHTTKDGRELVVESRQQVVELNGRRVVLESNRDITDRRAGEGQVALLIVIGDLINNLTNPSELLYAASKAVGQYFKAKRCLFNEIHLENDLEIVHRDYCRRGVESVAGKHKLSAYSPITSDEMKAGRTVINTDSKTDPRTANLYKQTYESAGERSYVAVPLMRDGKWKASLWISDDQPREWSRAEIMLLEMVGERVWLAVEKRQNETALRESSERFSKIFNSSPLAIIITSLKNRKMIDVNDAFVELTGFSRSEALGCSTTEIGLWQSPPEREELFSTFLRNRKLRHLECRFRTKAGVEFVGLVSAELIEIGGDQCGLTVIQDITQRKNTEDQLRESIAEIGRQRRLYESILNNTPDLAYIFDLDHRFIYVNDGLLKMWGKTRDEAIGRTCLELGYEPWHAAMHDREIDLIVATGQTVRGEVPFDGVLGRRIYDYILVPVISANGNVEAVAGTTRDITEIKLAEDALRESEERRQLAQDAGNVGIFDWDIIGRKTYWSETMWSFYGEKASDINPDEAFWSAHLHDNDRERVKFHIQEVLESTCDEFRDEFRVVRSDGSIRWIEAGAKVSRDPSGRATRMYGVNSDITARKEAEERTRLSENQLRLVTNALPALISYVDKNERYRFANETFTDWFGIPTDKIIGKGPRDIFGSEAYRVLKPRINEALSGQKCTFETVLSYKGAGDKYVHISYIPDIGANGTIHGYYGLTHDLTDLKLSQDLLRSSEERIGLLTDSFTDYAIISMDKEGLIDSWNKGAEIIYGYTQEEVLGHSYELIFTPEDIALAVPSREMKNARRKGRASYEGWRLKKDGSRFYASAVMMPLYLGKTLTGYAKIGSDLTEKKRHAEALQRSHSELEARVKERTKELAESNSALMQEIQEREITEKQRIELLGRLVEGQELERRRIARDLHDQLGQRLTALRLKLASLDEVSVGNEQFTPRVKRLQEIAERLDSEVSFLAWELRPTALDDLGLVEALAAFVNEWSRHHEMLADFHSAGLSKDRLDQEIETHLYRITQEALNNIAKHAGATHVTVLLERREQNVMLIVEDDGKGFDTNKKRGSGKASMGLGLIGMSERAALIGGEIEIESAHGKGTTIYVRLPYSN